MVVSAGTPEMPYGWKSALLYPTEEAALEGARVVEAAPWTRFRAVGVWKEVLWGPQEGDVEERLWRTIASCGAG